MQSVAQLILISIIAVFGYGGMLRLILRKTSNQRAVPLISFVLLLIYVCIFIYCAVLVRAMGNVGAFLYGILIVMAVFVLAALIFFIVKNGSQIRKIPLALFTIYFFVVIYITVLSRVGSFEKKIQMDVFSNIYTAIEQRSIQPLNHAILNVALFVPIGILFPMIHPKKLNKMFLIIPMGTMLSTVIESIQLIFSWGMCDIDDIIANTIGAVSGLVLYRICKKTGII